MINRALIIPGRGLSVAALLMASYLTVNVSTTMNRPIDNRETNNLYSSHAGEWRLVTDQVMGGRSNGTLKADVYKGQPCLRLQGLVSTANNGGFIQAALDLAHDSVNDASAYDGVSIHIAGNEERYNVHLRTSQLWLPWQSYRSEILPGPEWQVIKLPFAAFKPYRTRSRLNTSRLERVAIVAIGRQFEANICIGKLSYYTEEHNH